MSHLFVCALDYDQAAEFFGFLEGRVSRYRHVSGGGDGEWTAETVAYSRLPRILDGANMLFLVEIDDPANAALFKTFWSDHAIHVESDDQLEADRRNARPISRR